jgi:hypothetical protein
MLNAAGDCDIDWLEVRVMRCGDVLMTSSPPPMTYLESFKFPTFEQEDKALIDYYHYDPDSLEESYFHKDVLGNYPFGVLSDHSLRSLDFAPHHHPVWRQRQREIPPRTVSRGVNPLPLSTPLPRTPNGVRIPPYSLHSTKHCTPDGVRLLAGRASQ